MVGRRIARTEYAGSEPVQDERWAHAGDHVLLKFGPGGQVVERYLYGPQTDQLLAVTREGAGPGNTPLVLWTLSDHQGTVRDVIDSTGVVRKHWAYDSFGNVTATSGDPTLTFDHLYTGREYDATTGLYFYRARWYDPAVGRFISRDPQGLGDGPNPFAYVQNHAVSATDPSGELAWFVLPLIFGGIGAAHAGSMARARGDSWWWTGGQAALGAVSGVFNPWATTLGAAGAVGGAVIGYGTDGWRGAYYGAEVGGLVGLLGGGFVDAYRLRTAFGPLPACAVTRPYLLPSMQLGGAGVGGYLGYRATGSWDGALAGANVGMLLGGIGATTYNLLRPCFAAGTPIRTAEGSKPIEEVVAGDHILSRDENDPEGPVLLKVVEETFVRTGRIWVLRIDG